MSDQSIDAPGMGEAAARGTAQSVALGIQAMEGVCAMRAPFRDDLVDDVESGGLANGVITTLLDQTCGMAVSMASRAGAPGDAAFQRFGTMATLDLRIDFMRPAKPGRDVVGEAECYHLAGGVGFVRGLAFEDDPADPIAAVQAAFMLTEPPPAGA